MQNILEIFPHFYNGSSALLQLATKLEIDFLKEYNLSSIGSISSWNQIDTMMSI